MRATRLRASHEPEVEALLERDPIVNLFLLGVVDAQGVERTPFWGAFAGRELRAVALVLPTRLAVPYARDLEAAAAIGTALKGREAPCLMIGPREAGDAMWSAWVPARFRAARWYDQRLYSARTRPPNPGVKGFRQARLADLDQVARNSAQMELEDLGFDPSAADPEGYRTVVRERIEGGRTWVIERDKRVVFQINVGTQSAWGCQVGGTWVPPNQRGQGFAKAGMRALLHVLLPAARVVTLHVNEANKPAVAVYEATGFQREAPFRLATVQEHPSAASK